MSRQAPVIIDQTPITTTGSRTDLSHQVAESEWASLANQLPENERIVITQQNTYTIERQQLPDPNTIPAKPPTNWSGIILAAGILMSCLFAYSMYLQHGGQ